jgi:hypothetical protein
MSRYSPSMLTLALGAGFLLLVLVGVGPLDSARLRPTELQAAPEVAAPMIQDLAALTPDQAAALDGKRCRWRVQMAGPPDRQGSRDVYEV